MHTQWCEVSRDLLTSNYREFQRLAGAETVIAPVVKANAYGHGLVEVASVLREAGATWLCVNEIAEAVRLRAAGDTGTIYVVGYVPRGDLQAVVDSRAEIVVYNGETVDWLAELSRSAAQPIRLHVKLETGNNRQGIEADAALKLVQTIQQTPGLALGGVSTHFADIEDTTDHAFAMSQLARFRDFTVRLRQHGIDPGVRHCNNTAATILYPETYFDLARVGIGVYGMWPSRETMVTAFQARRHQITLRPTLTWKARVAQVKTVGKGQFIGYGRSYQTTHPTTLAIIPVGYYDGYDRRLSNLAHVLIRGQRAPVRGRVCMNMIMVDVTHIGDVALEDEVVLLGAQGDQVITAEQLAGWIGTINYEVTTRINDRIPRVVV